MKKADRLARAARTRALLELDSEPSIPPTQEAAPQPRPKAKAGKTAAQEAPAGRVRAGGRSRGPLPAEVQRAEIAPPPKLTPPVNWLEGPPARGTLVFYKGTRYFVERSPVSWAESVYVCISDHRPLDRNGEKHAVEKRESFYVDGGSLSKAPDPGRYSARLPTVASVERAARAKVGVRDTGDDIAVLLRACDSLEAVYKAASEYLGDPLQGLHGKYDKLNPGQQRMVLGNRMRAKWRKEHV